MEDKMKNEEVVFQLSGVHYVSDCPEGVILCGYSRKLDEQHLRKTAQNAVADIDEANSLEMTAIERVMLQHALQEAAINAVSKITLLRGITLT
jgi:hypothetical protein